MLKEINKTYSNTYSSIIGCYQVERKLGEGAQATVFLVSDSKDNNKK